MGTYKFVNLAVFIIFFGIALIEVFQRQHWIEVALFLALGALSLWADSKEKTKSLMTSYKHTNYYHKPLDTNILKYSST